MPVKKEENMIYIRTKYDELCEDTNVIAVYDVGFNDAEDRYKKFMIEKSIEVGININPHWLNAMDYENNNYNMTKSEYESKEKQWNKILRTWNIGRFICDVLKGYKVTYRTI